MEALLSEEIRRLVADANAKRSVIEVLDCVAKLRAVYPNSLLSKRQITNEIVTAASAAGIPVAFTRAELEPAQERRLGTKSA